jgi:hypothetical protein
MGKYNDIKKYLAKEGLEFHNRFIAACDGHVLITNFLSNDRVIYEQAITNSGMKHLYISEGATDKIGHPLPNLLRLMAGDRRDLSAFWEEVKRLKNG